MSIKIFSLCGADDSYIQDMADRMGSELFKGGETIPEDELILVYDEDGLSLCRGTLKMRGDLTKMAKRLKQPNLKNELIVKAAKIKTKDPDKELFAIDATAGMGEDSLLLAAAGFTVRLYEKDPVIAALLEDALRRAADEKELEETVKRMQVVCGDSIEALNNVDRQPDIVLLDPMFPKRNKSALIKKKFQLLQQLEKPCEDERDLLKAAMAAKPRKIIIKRPLKGPFLDDIKPDYSLSGKAIRYDCFAFAR